MRHLPKTMPLMITFTIQKERETFLYFHPSVSAMDEYMKHYSIYLHNIIHYYAPQLLILSCRVVGSGKKERKLTFISFPLRGTFSTHGSLHRVDDSAVFFNLQHFNIFFIFNSHLIILTLTRTLYFS